MTYPMGTVTVPWPAFADPAVQAWAVSVLGCLEDMQKQLNSLQTEVGKDGTTDLSGTVNSGDATTDDVIEAMRTALVANGYGTNG